MGIIIEGALCKHKKVRWRGLPTTSPLVNATGGGIGSCAPFRKSIIDVRLTHFFAIISLLRTQKKYSKVSELEKNYVLIITFNEERQTKVIINRKPVMIAKTVL